VFVGLIQFKNIQYKHTETRSALRSEILFAVQLNTNYNFYALFAKL